MKKFVLIFLFMFILFPNCVSANIMCNDGTRSPSCTDCHRGCCSHHGGCAVNSGSSNTYGSYSSSRTQTYVYGCTNRNSINYNARANRDDGSCIAIVKGCTNKDAFNYNANANTDDGSCISKKYGCIDSYAINFDSSANTSDDSCQYKKEISEVKKIEYDTEYVKSDEIARGEFNVKRKGELGKKEILFEVIVDEYDNVISKTKKSEKIISNPVNEIIEEGTKVSNPIFSIIWIISLIVVFINKSKFKNKLIINMFNKFSKPIKIILYIVYVLLILPVFIDVFIMIKEKIISFKNN